MFLPHLKLNYAKTKSRDFEQKYFFSCYPAKRAKLMHDSNYLMITRFS